MSIQRTIPATFLNYKSMDLTPKALNFLSQRHNTKDGTWAEIVLSRGQADFEFLDKENQVNLTELVKENTPFIVPPAAWHRLKPKTENIAGCINFYCHPLVYFQKKYRLTKPHSAVVTLNDLYLKTLFEHAKKLHVFDLGCGRGRNSLYLSRFGHQIRAADIDPGQLATLSKIVEEEKIVNIQIQTMNLEEPEIENQFDVFLLNVVLQFLAKEKAWSLLNLAKQQTHINGLHSIVCPMQTPGMEWPEHFTFLLKADELRDFYLDGSWSILEYNEDFGNLHRLDDDGLPIRGRFASLLAQKII